MPLSISLDKSIEIELSKLGKKIDTIRNKFLKDFLKFNFKRFIKNL